MAEPEVNALLNAALEAAKSISEETKFSWRCRFGIHNWSGWNLLDEGPLVHPHTKGIVGRFYYYSRHCLRCYEPEHKKVRSE